VDKEIIERLTGEGRETEAKGLAAGFALIAYADAHLDPREIIRFEALTKRDPYLAKIKCATTMAAFDMFCAMLREDYTTGKRAALRAVAEAALVPGVKEPLVRMVQIAIVADHRLAEQEEVMLKDIAEAAAIPLNRL